MLHSRGRRSPIAFLLLAIGPIVLIALIVAGCGSSETPEEKQHKAFCSDLRDLDRDTNDLTSAVRSLDRSNIEGAVSKVQSDVQDVKSSGQAIKSSNSGQIETAFNDVKTSVQNIGQGGGSSSLSAVGTSLTTLSNTVKSTLSDYKCN